MDYIAKNKMGDNMKNKLILIPQMGSYPEALPR